MRDEARAEARASPVPPVPTSATHRQIQADFDAIAELLPDGGQAGVHEEWLLNNLPDSRGSALELGCGVGYLSRRLATVFQHVDAVDLAEQMIAKARRNTPSEASIEYVCSDMFTWLANHPNVYDCIVTVATLHHVDLASALRSMALSLKPGGRLLVLDLEDRRGWKHFVPNTFAWLTARLHDLRNIRHGWALRRQYGQHARNETYLTREEVMRVTDEELPGASVRSHLLWRYSILWDKP